MEQTSPPIPQLLAYLDVPQEGRVLDFAAGTGHFGMALATARPDALVVVWEKDPDLMNAIMKNAFEQRFENLVVGDTPAGPPADRGLAVNVLSKAEDLDLVTLRNAVCPEGHVLFVDEAAAFDGARERLKQLGYTTLEKVEAPDMPAHFVLRAR